MQDPSLFIENVKSRSNPEELLWLKDTRDEPQSTSGVEAATQHSGRWLTGLSSTLTKVKQYLVLNMDIMKNNFFAVVTRKLFEIPKKIQTVSNFLDNLKRKFKRVIREKFVSRWRRTSGNKMKKEMLRIRTKVKKEINKPTSIEQYTMSQVFTIRNRLISFATWVGLPGLTYFNEYPNIALNFLPENDAGLFEKAKARVKLWVRLADRPRVPRKRWQQLLKRMHYKKKKLFKFIRKEMLFKKKRMFSILLLQRRTRRYFKARHVMKNYAVLHINNKEGHFVDIHFTQQLFDFFANFLNNLKLMTAPVRNIMDTDVQDTFMTLKRRYQFHILRQHKKFIRTQILPKSSVVVWGSAGKLGFKSNKRTTPYATEILGKYISRYLKRRRIKFINIEFSQRINKKIRAFFKGFNQAGLKILRFYYKRKIMFGSIRGPKIRRV